MKRLLLFLLCALLAAPALAFDQSHAAWNALLKTHVKEQRGGGATQVDYAGFKRDAEALDTYTKSLSKVSAAEFGKFGKADQMAFLINAYNAFTIQLILTRYPDVKSIRDLGAAFSSPWKQKFFELLGERSFLDHVEHELLRAPGRYDDPRIHFAVNCASIGCPALRDEAYVGVKLDGQLDDAMRRFLSDRTRNRYAADKDALEVSKIFDWYGKDFSLGHKGFDSVAQTLSKFAPQLADTEAGRSRVLGTRAPLRFLDYDWRLNDVAH